MAIPISKTVPIPAIVAISIFLVAVAGSVYAGNQSNLSGNNIPTNAVRAIRPASRKLYRFSWQAKQFLDAHNRVRKRHNVPPLEWSQPAARYAKRYAKKLAADCKMIHSYGKYGENLMWGSHYEKNTPAEVVNLWASEKNDYDAARNTCAENKDCGHYTQLVWMDTTKVGCAKVRCNSGGVIAVCNYDPPGNYQGESPFARHI